MIQLIPTPRRLASGLALGLLVAVGAASWGAARASLKAERGLEAEDAEALARELAESVERTGLEPEAAARAVSRFTELHPGTAAVRVIDLPGKRLVASTAPDDTAERAAPRRLTFDEKPLFDLGQELRAAVETNRRGDGVPRPEIDVRVRGDLIAVAAPVATAEEGREGEVVGTVLLDLDRGARAPGVPAAAGISPWLAGLVAVAAALGLFLALALGPDLPWGVPTLRRRPALLAALAVLLFLAAVAAFGAWAVAGIPEPLFAGRFVRLAGWGAAAGLALLLFVGLGAGTRTGRALARHRRPYLYAVPALVTMLVLVYFPFFYGITLSFTNANIYNTDQPITELWIGFDNFREILSDTDVVQETPSGRVVDYSSFYWTLGFTVVWTITNVSIGVSVGLLLALILHRKGFALKPIYRVILILPWAMPNYITALIWQGMFHSQFGTINQLIQIFGGEPVSWFDTPFTAFLTVLSTNGWLSFPFMMVISLGALQSIPADLYEAARVDGATGFQQFRAITLPSLKPALVPAVIISVIWTFNMFNIIYLVSGGNPGGSTEILITQAYKIAFEQYRYGYAAAYSTVIFLILFAYGAWQNRVTRATEGI
jgi:arabinogalactan oligomer/maltooligosaccharide transport system permease protein